MTAWPLTTEVQTDFNASVRFKARRPWTGTQTRWHAGVDLRAKEGANIVAPEPCIIIDTDRGWEGTAKATLVHTLSGHTLILGCTLLGSAPPVGTAVPTGGVLARVGFYTKTNGVHSSMLHLQVYKGLLTPAQANARQSWKVNAPQPEGLMDPLVYLADAKKLPAKDLPNENPPGPFVSASDGRNGGKPCHTVNGVQVCSLPDVSAWRAALASYRKAAEPLVVKANELVLEQKLLSWTPAASSSIDTLGDADILLNAHDNNEAEGLPDQQVGDLVELCVGVREAIEVLTKFVGQKIPSQSKDEKPSGGGSTPTPPADPKPAKRKSSGGAGIVAVAVVTVALGGAGIYAATR